MLSQKPTQIHKLPSVPTKRQEPTFSSLVRDVLEGYVDDRLVRCSKCGVPHPETLSAVATCSVCIYTVGRCHNCGGEAGARRSVIAHIRALSIPRWVNRFGDHHAFAVAQMKKDVTSIKNLRHARKVRAMRGR